MLKIYGSRLCKDCIDCMSDLDRAGVGYTFFDFADDLKNLKAFLSIRDTSPLFDEARDAGSIGIPCIVQENGDITLSWDAFLP